MTAQLQLRLEGFEGPLDLLLELARTQKVDLQSLSLLQLAQQYLDFIAQARHLQLELAADWLVMAAWLTWLKSRLLLPQPESDADAELEEASDQLQARLAELARVQAATAWLQARPRLGRDVFARAETEDHTVRTTGPLEGDVTRLVSAYLTARRRSARRRHYRPPPVRYWTVQQARTTLMRLLGARALQGGASGGWHNLLALLPELTPASSQAPSSAPLQARAARAALLVAGLELAKSGTLELRQPAEFAPIAWRPAPTPTPD
ncbi:segregation/condensation protein A [Oecophyllibacter saccharovorans]|nr:segregation/condensation protein A [Oecophyllibacter saccharovorans]